MRKVTIELESNSFYSQSKYAEHDPMKGETKEDTDKRCYREHLHVNEKGNVVILGIAIKNALCEAAKFRPQKGPSGGKSTWTKNFEAGLLPLDDMDLGIPQDDVEVEKLFLPSDGKRGSGKRVPKYYPLIPKWKGVCTLYVLDDQITQEIFKTYLGEAGLFIGLGRNRPRNNGWYGRFKVKEILWEDVASEIG